MLKDKLFIFPNKKLRSKVIKDYIEKQSYKKVVCFSCGNAVKELRAIGVDTLYVGEKGDLSANKWFKQYEIADMFPNYFDATSGHLPIELMVEISKEFREFIGDIPQDTLYVPTGSGESVICLKMAYPEKKFIAVYNLNKATEYSESAPLNSLVKAVCEDIIFYKEKV